MADGRRVFLDTNVLVLAAAVQAPLYATARAAIERHQAAATGELGLQ